MAKMGVNNIAIIPPKLVRLIRSVERVNKVLIEKG